MYVLPFGVIKNNNNSYTYNQRKLNVEVSLQTNNDTALVNRRHLNFKSNPTSFQQNIDVGFNVYPKCNLDT